jgi:hypothetical protein
MSPSKFLIRSVTFLFLLCISIGCSSDSNPIVRPAPGGENFSDSLSEPEFPAEPSQRQASSDIQTYYIEPTGPDDLVNTSLRLPWTLDRNPTFCGILHTVEESPVILTEATVNNKYCSNVIVAGDEVTFTPDFDLEYGYNHVYISVKFENGHIACAQWRFDLKKEPPKINGFLGDEKGRRYFICFDGEIESKEIENVSNWKLNGSSDLIEKVDYLNYGNWALVQLVGEDEKQGFRDQDYYLSFDCGKGSGTEMLLIPQEKPPRESEEGKGGGCATVIHNTNDIHFSQESEMHALTYEITYNEPECDLYVEWMLDTEIVYNRSNPATTPLYIDQSSAVGNPQQLAHRFPIGRGHHTLFFPWDRNSTLKVRIYEGNPTPYPIWESPYWRFPADVQPPELTQQPIMMTGAEASDFVEQHYWEKTELTPGQLPVWIQNLVDELNQPWNRCMKFVLWGAEDRYIGDSHLGCMGFKNIIDWGWDPNSPPFKIWIPPMSILDAFQIDLPPFAEYEPGVLWSDPAYNPLHADCYADGEYKLWVFPFEDWLNWYHDDIAGHEDTLIMRPRVMDTAEGGGNWLRADNIYSQFITSCQSGSSSVAVEFIFPEPGDRKQFINLAEGDNLPKELKAKEFRDDWIRVALRVTIPRNTVLPPGTKLVLSWLDPPIDGSPFTEASSNPPGRQARDPFPWLDTSAEYRKQCPDDPFALEAWPFDPPYENEAFPDPCLNGLDNSENRLNDFQRLNGRLCLYGAIILHYFQAGFSSSRYNPYIINLNDYFTDNCENYAIIDTVFYTSNFGGDNYILNAKVVFPPDSEVCGYAEHDGIISVWRKVYMEPTFMAHGYRDMCITYPKFKGPFYLENSIEYMRNAFDDCFIDIEEGYVEEFYTQYREVVEKNAIWDYASYYTRFLYRTTDHRTQLLYIDNLTGGLCPVRGVSYTMGATPIPYIERFHSGVALGTIYDLYHTLQEDRMIDGILTSNDRYITLNSAAHELGHALAFQEYSDIVTGHKSGPGLMWLTRGGVDDCLSAEGDKFDNNRMSYFWGDHVFVMRLNPVLP